MQSILGGSTKSVEEAKGREDGGRYSITLVPSMHGSKTERLVVVRYYLDRPGYDIDHSSARLWKNPPEKCFAPQIKQFLAHFGVGEGSGIITEVYLDRFRSYMMLDACSDIVEFDFSESTPSKPQVIDIRLTDTHGDASAESQAASQPRTCNMSPAGLFAFSMVVGLDAAAKTGGLVDGFVTPAYDLSFSVYAFFIGGLLQVLVGMWEVTRNNIYGATAFSTFGCFWLAGGLKLILTSYFPAQIPEEMMVSDPWATFMVTIYKCLFILVLLKQTFVMNRMTTLLISILAIDLFFGSISGFSKVIEWIDMVTAWMVTAIALWSFFAELTNEVYQREVFNMFPWREDSAEEIFGAAGRPSTLNQEAAKLRAAAPPASVFEYRSKQPSASKVVQVEK